MIWLFSLMKDFKNSFVFFIEVLIPFVIYGSKKFLTCLWDRDFRGTCWSSSAMIVLNNLSNGISWSSNSNWRVSQFMFEKSERKFSSSKFFHSLKEIFVLIFLIFWSKMRNWNEWSDIPAIKLPFETLYLFGVKKMLSMRVLVDSVTLVGGEMLSRRQKNWCLL